MHPPFLAACDVRVTELVDGNVGVHVMIPKSIVGK
jgi:acetamidase/formamidase